MRITPDELIFWRHGALKLNATIVYTWGLMALLAGGSRCVTRRLSGAPVISRWQSFLELIVTEIEEQIKEVGLDPPRRYLGFVGTLFAFVGGAALATVIPGYTPPTGSLSTTTALALCVFAAVPYFGVKEQGLARYLAT
jgi:F-type H+-transporting ATPase subunit a